MSEVKQLEAENVLDRQETDGMISKIVHYCFPYRNYLPNQ
jgi:hypothetical protein